MVFQGPAATIRWVGNEDGVAPNPCWNGISRADANPAPRPHSTSDPDGDTWMPNEVDVSIRRPDCFWSTKNENKVLTVGPTPLVYYTSVGRGCQLLLNIPANRDGLLAQPDCDSAAAFGRAIQHRFAKPVASASGSGAELLLRLPVPAKIDTVILQEDTTQGERVREYRIEGRSAGAWRKLADGTSIGHKRIQPIDPATVDALRLVAIDHVGTPAIRTFAAFNTGTTPPAGWNATPTVWADNLVGAWANNKFDLELTSKIDAAKQYRLRFVPSAGKVDSLKDVVLKLHGVPEPGLVKPVRGKPEELILDITGVAETVQISGHVLGAPTGQILLRKL